ncbi:hypothetical protein D3C87_1886370 [compost metagenome]
MRVNLSGDDARAGHCLPVQPFEPFGLIDKLVKGAGRFDLENEGRAVFGVEQEDAGCRLAKAILSATIAGEQRCQTGRKIDIETL